MRARTGCRVHSARLDCNTNQKELRLRVGHAKLVEAPTSMHKTQSWNEPYRGTLQTPTGLQLPVVIAVVNGVQTRLDKTATCISICAGWAPAPTGACGNQDECGIGQSRLQHPPSHTRARSGAMSGWARL